jgi:hypothetical protein
MMLLDTVATKSFEIVAPGASAVPSSFEQTVCDSERCSRRISEIQRLRGQVYLADGAIRKEDLTADGRQVDPADDSAWHIVITGSGQEVVGCIRIAHLGMSPSFSQFHQHEIIERMPEPSRGHYRLAFQNVISDPNKKEIGFGDTGAWAVAKGAHNHGLGVALIIVGWALYRHLGDAWVMAMATQRHRASELLKALGASALAMDGVPLPSFFDPAYDCTMELLVFDTRHPSELAAAHVDELTRIIARHPVIYPA